MARGNRDLMTEALQMQRGVSANQARAADDENFHDVFLFLFCISKSIRHSSRVFRETKRIEGQPARLLDTPRHSARRSGRTDFDDSACTRAARARPAAPHSIQPALRRTSHRSTRRELSWRLPFTRQSVALGQTL